MSRVTQLRHAIANRLVERVDPKSRADFTDEFRSMLERCKPHSMTSPERMFGVYEAVRHVVREGIPGDIVECGVWRGGSSMMAAFTLMLEGDEDRRLWLYDTYAGMSKPTAEDGPDAARRWATSRSGDHSEWCYAPIEVVRSNVMSTGMDEGRVEFVQGPVEETIPARTPELISVLRLDTDFYSSTRHELEHLWPRLSPGGVLIVDDYGHWGGARQAVDEFFHQHRPRPFLARQDYTGRVAIKPLQSDAQ